VVTVAANNQTEDSTMLKTTITLVAATTFLVALASSVAAATVATHVLDHSASVSGSCLATNLSDKGVRVQVQIVRNGVLDFDSAVTVSPGSTAGFILSAGGGEDRCVFIFDGNKEDVRGVLLLNDSTGTTLIAAEAR
jgi:hypothetical protein